MATFTHTTTDTETAFTFSYDDIADRLHARIAQINHNLAPDPDTMTDSLSWNERLDKALARFAAAMAAARVQQRLAAWGAGLEVETERVTVRLAAGATMRTLAPLVGRQMENVLFHSVCADKLTLGIAPLRQAVSRMRDEHLERAETALDGLACTMALTDNNLHG